MEKPERKEEDPRQSFSLQPPGPALNIGIADCEQAGLLVGLAEACLL